MSELVERTEQEAAGPAAFGGPLWTIDDVAGFLGVAPKTVRKWQLNGTIPFVKLGGKLIRFRPADVRAWVDGHVVTAHSGGNESPLLIDLRRRLTQ